MGEIDEFLDRQTPEARVLAKRLISLIKAAIPGVMETTNSKGNPVYSIGGRNVVWVACGRAHAELGFFDGILLSSTLLQGNGRKLRHIIIQARGKLDEKEIDRLLRDAAGAK